MLALWIREWTLALSLLGCMRCPVEVGIELFDHPQQVFLSRYRHGLTVFFAVVVEVDLVFKDHRPRHLLRPGQSQPRTEQLGSIQHFDVCLHRMW